MNISKQISKIKLVNKYMIICDLRDWQIIRRRIACFWILDLRHCVGMTNNNNNNNNE